jgi:hypothetical protein
MHSNCGAPDGDLVCPWKGDRIEERCNETLDGVADARSGDCWCCRVGWCFGSGVTHGLIFDERSDSLKSREFEFAGISFDEQK